jgi:hypothetical protein
MKNMSADWAVQGVKLMLNHFPFHTVLLLEPE